MSVMDEMVLIPRWWLVGRPADLWAQHASVIENFVREQRLEPVAMQQLAMLEEMPAAVPTHGVASRLPKPSHFPGGLPRIPHLHLGDQIYRLSPEQWEKFSGAIVSSFAKKLAGAKSVSLSNLLDLSAAIDAVG